ncbi:MAG: exodeoxyribonuclease V subunit alpha [Propionibacterium sp.]|nr:exodeoxyribonuclease V subunit alpha [Propionibacterium sp.]
MHEIPISATGRLREFAEAGMIALADFHLARRMAHGFEDRDDVVLACALAVRELRHGSVCLPLATAHELKPTTEIDDGHEVAPVALQWPEPDSWAAEVASSRIVGEGCPFTFVDGRLYLTRFYVQERQVADALAERRGLPITDIFTVLEGTGDPDAAQDRAVEAAMRHMTSVVTGGPGTGKTTTVVRILNSLGAAAPISVALAAPTGRAARQLFDSVRGKLHDDATSEVTHGTLHRILGKRVRGPGATHHRDNPLPHDVVVLDESSMVSLEHMASLLDALAHTTRLVLVGDPHQLRSVEAGAVLADIVANPALTQTGSVVELQTNRRSNQDIAELARAIDAGDAEGALAMIEASSTIEWFDYDAQPIASLPRFRDDVRSTALDVVAASSAGDAKSALAALRRHRVLCAHRLGRHGVQGWSRAAREVIAAALPSYGAAERYVGQPLLLTQNTDAFNNGDVAVIVEQDGALVAAVDQGGQPLLVPPVLLEDAHDLHAMTIHKSQGGQYDTVSVVLPPVGSPLATRELVYTGITRARTALRIYGTREAFVESLATPVRRASGLASA